MAQSLNYDIDSMGGYGGMGGFGNNPLMWLITLGFLRDGGGLGGNNNNQAGVFAGSTDAKLDCLTQQHSSLANQLQQNEVLAGLRGNSDQIRDLAAQAAECCCETKIAIQEVNTNMANQTAILTASGLANTQAVLDRLNVSDLQAKDAEIRKLEQSVQTATIVAACGAANPMNIDIVQRQRQAQGQV